MTIEQFADQLVTLTVTDLIELKKVLKDKYNLEIEQPVALLPVKEEKVVEEKTMFNVIIKKISAISPEKFGVIRLVKEITGLELKIAKESIETLPFTIAENVSQIEANAIADKLKTFNAEVEIS